MATKLIKQKFDNGIEKECGYLNNRLKEGIWKFYYENGNLYKEINFKDDIENGQWKMWHENGNIYIDQNKINGSSDGYWKEYYENGELKEIGFYEKGEYAPRDFWDENGNQLLINGTGKKIERFGYNDLDICEFYFQDGKFIKEIKIESAKYNKFKENDEGSLL